MYANQHASAGGHHFKEGVGVRLALPQIHPGQGGFLQPVDVADHMPILPQAKGPVLVNAEQKTAVGIFKCLPYQRVAEVIGDVGILRRVFVNRGAAGDAGPGGNVRHGLRPQGVGPPEKSLGIAGAGRADHSEVRANHKGGFLLHVHAVRRRARAVQQHHAQRQGQHDKGRPPPVPAQVGPGQPGDAGPWGASAGGPPPAAVLHVAESLDRRGVGGDSDWFAGAAKDGQRRQSRGGQEERRRGGHAGGQVFVLGGNHVHNQGQGGFSDEEARQQSQGNPHAAEPEGLPVHQPPHLFPAHADGPVQAEAADVLHDGDVEHVVDQQIAAEGKQHGKSARRRHLEWAGLDVGDAVHGGLHIVGGSGVIRLAAQVIDQLPEAFFQACGTADGEIGEIGPGHIPVFVESELEDFRVGLPEGGSGPHDAQLTVQGLVPAGDHHGEGVVPPVGGELDDDLRTGLRFHAQGPQGEVGGGCLIGRGGRPAVGGGTESQPRLDFILDVELNVMADGVGEVGHRHPQSCRLNEVRLPQGLELLRRHEPELAVGAAHFLHLHGQGEGFHRAQYNCGDGGKEHRRQGNGQHRDPVPDPAGGEAPPGQNVQHILHGKLLLNLLLDPEYQSNVTIAVQKCCSFVPFTPAKGRRPGRDRGARG